MRSDNSVDKQTAHYIKPVIFSFFSGCGFLDLGFEITGFDIDLVNEFHKPFMDAYRYARKGMKLREPRFGYYNTDINDFLGDRSSELRGFMDTVHSEGNLVGFIGGPPCPDFSIAGKNRGREGDNGKLSASYVNLIVSMHPDFFLFENVKGLWRTARHREFFEELKGKLQAAGYIMTERLTNSLEYGAPQDRDRILLFGVHKSLCQDCDISTFPWLKYQKYTLEAIKAMPWPETEAFEKDSTTKCPRGVPKELTVEYWFQRNKVDTHPNASNYFIPHNGAARMAEIPEGDVSHKSYKRLHRWRYSPTVAYGNNEVHLHPYKARRLSVAEALSLQSLPAKFVLPEDMTLTNMFKTIGNGVPFLLSQGIAKTILDYLNDIVRQNAEEGHHEI